MAEQFLAQYGFRPPPQISDEYQCFCSVGDEKRILTVIPYFTRDAQDQFHKELSTRCYYPENVLLKHIDSYFDSETKRGYVVESVLGLEEFQIVEIGKEKSEYMKVINGQKVHVQVVSLPDDEKQLHFLAQMRNLQNSTKNASVKFTQYYGDRDSHIGFAATAVKTLEEYLNDGNRVSEPKAIRWLKLLIDLPNVRTQLTPKNVFVTYCEGALTLKVLNFDLQDRATPEKYRAPQAQSSPDFSVEAWHLGVILFELLSGLQDDYVNILQQWNEVKRDSVFEARTDSLLSRLLEGKDWAIAARLLNWIIEEMENKICGKYLISPSIEQRRSSHSTLYFVPWTKNNIKLTVAIKETPFSNLEQKSRFEHELQAISSVHSPYIVKYLDYEVRNDKGYVVMEYVKGTSLHEFRLKHEIPLQDVFRWLREITEALETMWKKSIAHRTLSSHHVLLCGEGLSSDVKLCGFSWSKCISDQETLTATTPLLYLPPELKDGSNPYTEKSDIWLLGILLYEMVLGPIEMHDSVDVLLRKVENHSVFRCSMTLVDRMLRDNPADRISYQELIGLLNDRFIPGKAPLGAGPFGNVYKVIDSLTGSTLAMKKIIKSHYETFGRMLDTMRAGQSPFVVKFIESYEDETYLYVYMELCEGGDLRKFITSHDLIPVDVARKWMGQLLQGLKHLQDQHVLHRDIKPENILLTKNDFSADVKFTDFTIAKFLQEDALNTIGVGTRRYMAPERIEPPGRYSFPSDIWSLGCVFYEILEKQSAYVKDTNIEMLEAQRNLPHFQHSPQLASDLIKKMLTFRACDRIKVADCLQHPFFRESLQILNLPANEDEVIDAKCVLVGEMITFVNESKECLNVLWLFLLLARKLVESMQYRSTISQQSKEIIHRYIDKLAEEIHCFRQIAAEDLRSLEVANVSKLCKAIERGGSYIVPEKVAYLLKETSKYAQEQLMKHQINISKVREEHLRREVDYWKNSIFHSFAQCSDFCIAQSTAEVTFYLSSDFLTLFPPIKALASSDECYALKFIRAYALLFAPTAYYEYLHSDALLTHFKLKERIRKFCFGLSKDTGLQLKYMSEEQDSGSQPTSKDNVWALGVLCYELAMGRPCTATNKLSIGAVKELLRDMEHTGKEKLGNLASRMLDFRTSDRISFHEIVAVCDSYLQRVTVLSDSNATRVFLIENLWDGSQLITKKVEISGFVVADLSPHSSLVQCRGGTSNGTNTSFSFDYWPGGSLEQFIKRRGPLFEVTAHKFMCQLLKLVSALHASGYVHGALHAAGVVLNTENEDAEMRLVDFRIRKELMKIRKIAPEIVLNAHSDPFWEGNMENPAGDVWGLGCLFHFILSGEHLAEPFTEDSISAQISELKVSNECREMIRNMLAIDPKRRVSLDQCRSGKIFRSDMSGNPERYISLVSDNPSLECMRPGLDQATRERIFIEKIVLKDEQRADFQRDADIARKLNSPHFAKTLYANAHTGIVVVQCGIGWTLKQCLETHKYLDELPACQCALQLVKALQSFWSRQMSYGGVSPSNIILEKTPDGMWEIRPTAFGFSRTIRDYDSRSWKYLAPKVRSGKVTTIESNLWTVGAVLLEMMVGIQDEINAEALETSAVSEDTKKIVRRLLAEEGSDGNELEQALEKRITEMTA